VVQVEGATALTVCLDGLVDAPVQPNEVTARTEGEPVQIDAGIRGLIRERWL
jgi:hypothetical protein